jgi:hypothetical protein
MSRFTRALVAMVAVGLMVATAQPRGQDRKQANVTGTWDVMVKGSGAHGDLAATMILKQEGTTVTGSFSAHGNEHGLEGTLEAGALELAATDMPADVRLVLSAKLQSDGTLSGSLSGPVADSRWTATRAKDKQ